jgi:hypothetical protein
MAVVASPFDHVEAEHAAFDGAVPHRHAARFFQAHLAGQLEVGREHPAGPAGKILLPVAGQLAEELAAVFGNGLLARAKLAFKIGRRASRPCAARRVRPSAWRAHRLQHRQRQCARHMRGVEQQNAGNVGGRHALQGVAAAELHHVGHARAFGVALGKVDHAVRHVAAINQGFMACRRLNHCVRQLLF